MGENLWSLAPVVSFLPPCCSWAPSQLSFPCVCHGILPLTCSQLFRIVVSLHYCHIFSRRQPTCFLPQAMKQKAVLNHSYVSFLFSPGSCSHFNWEQILFLLWRKNCLLRLLNFSGRVLFASDIILSFKELLKINFFEEVGRQGIWGELWKWIEQKHAGFFFLFFFFLATGHFRAYF